MHWIHLKIFLRISPDRHGKRIALYAKYFDEFENGFFLNDFLFIFLRVYIIILL